MASEPLTVAVISEGITDHTVLASIVYGLTPRDADDPHIQFPYPLVQRGHAATPDTQGGWEPMFSYLRDGALDKALQTNDLVIIHVDTDVAEQKNFDIPHHVAHGDPNDLMDAVHAKLVEICGAAVYEANAQRICFAIAVNEIECWLLAHYKPAKKAKVTGCFTATNAVLRAKNLPALGGDPKNKVKRSYDKAAAPLTKERALHKAAQHAPSLQRFLDCLGPKLQPVG